MNHFFIYSYSILICLWASFYIYWFVSAMSAKKNIRTNRPGIFIRLLFVVVIILVVENSSVVRHVIGSDIHNLPLNILGLALCAAGLAFAVWARIHIGKNWGMPMSVKENPELVTSGPYRLVRHPIYSGIMLAMIGSGLTSNAIWFILVIFFVVYFIFSARREEALMTREFPDQYPAYKKRTKMLIPFVL